MNKIMLIGIVCVSLQPVSTALALSFALPSDNSDIVGDVQVVEVTNPTTLQEVGHAYGVGPNEMKSANPERYCNKSG